MLLLSKSGDHEREHWHRLLAWHPGYGSKAEIQPAFGGVLRMFTMVAYVCKLRDTAFTRTAVVVVAF